MADSSCAHCAQSGASKLCSGCRRVHYCSAICQSSDWKKHKKQCKRWRKQIRAPKKSRTLSNKMKKKKKKKKNNNRLAMNMQNLFKARASNDSTNRTATNIGSDSYKLVKISKKQHIDSIQYSINTRLKPSVYDEIYSFVTGYKGTLTLKNETNGKTVKVDAHTMSYYEGLIRKAQHIKKINPYSIHVVYNDDDPEFGETIDICMNFVDRNASNQQKYYPLITMRKSQIVNIKSAANKLLISPRNLAQLIKYSLDSFGLIHVGCNTIGVSQNVTRDVSFRTNVVKHARELIMGLIMESPDLRSRDQENDPFGFGSIMFDSMADTFGKDKADMMSSMLNNFKM